MIAMVEGGPVFGNKVNITRLRAYIATLGARLQLGLRRLGNVRGTQELVRGHKGVVARLLEVAKRQKGERRAAGRMR